MSTTPPPSPQEETVNATQLPQAKRGLLAKVAWFFKVTVALAAFALVVSAATVLIWQYNKSTKLESEEKSMAAVKKKDTQATAVSSFTPQPNFDHQTRPVTQESPRLKSLRQDQRELEREIKELKKQKQAIEDQSQKQKRDLDRLQREKSKLEDELKTLTSQIDMLRSFQNATLVVLSPNSKAVALSRRGEDFYVLAKAEAQLAGIADRAAARVAIPRIPDSRLTGKIIYQVGKDKSLTSSLASQVRSHLVTQSYRRATTNEFVVYHDLTKKATKIGYLDKLDDNNLVCQTVSASPVTIHSSQIRPGSAMRGQPARLMEIAGDVNFLDYVALKVADLFSADKYMQQRVCMGIEVNHDAKAISSELARVERDLSKAAATEATLFNVPVYGYFIARGVSLNRRRRASEPAIDFSRVAEDKLYSSLLALKMTVVEQEHRASVERAFSKMREGASNQNSLENTFRKLGYATHMLYIDVGERLPNGNFLISARVVDIAAGGRDLWAETGGAYFKPPHPPSNWLDQSGKMVLLNKKERQRSRNELPLTGAKASERVGFVLTALRSKQHVAFRELFSRQITRIRKDQIDAERSREVNSFEDVGVTNRLRYLTRMIVQACMPSAGRVVGIDHPGNRASVSLAGAADNYTEGDTFYAVRTYESNPNYPNQNTEVSEDRLPYHLVVRNVSKNKIALQLQTPDVDVLWRDKMELEVGDVVQPRFYREPKIYFPGVSSLQPVKEDQFRLKWNKPNRKKWIDGNTLTFAQTFDTRLRAAIQEAGATVNQPTARSRAADVTHVLGVTVRPVHPQTDKKKTFVTTVRMKSTDGGKDVVSIAFEIDASDVEGWQP